jgi:hypothetical protein
MFMRRTILTATIRVVGKHCLLLSKKAMIMNITKKRKNGVLLRLRDSHCCFPLKLEKKNCEVKKNRT